MRLADCRRSCAAPRCTRWRWWRRRSSAAWWQCAHPGRSNHMRTHVTLFDSMPTPPVPTLLVRFVGPFTSAEIARKKLAFDVRRATIDGLLTFVRANNSLDAYKTPPDDAALATLPLVAGAGARRARAGHRPTLQLLACRHCSATRSSTSKLASMFSSTATASGSIDR